MADITTTKAIVLAAGLGKRMRPLTDTLPKPMIKVGNKCLVDHALDWLVAAGIQETVVNTHYLAPLLEAHLLKRTSPRITLSHEDTLLETGGGIAKALPMLGSTAFFAVNSDTICLNGNEHALHNLFREWDDETMDALLLLHPVARAVGYDGQGDFLLDGDGVVVRRSPDAHAPYVFTGIQMIHPRLFTDAPAGAFSMNLLYNRNMLENGRLPRIHGLVHDGNWLHVGEPTAIPLAEAFL